MRSTSTDAASDGPVRSLPESTRVEAFSDGVFAIAVTLLVLDLHSDFARGDFGHELAHQWPEYLGYAAAFLNISSIWINHHDLFTRVRAVNAKLITLNLLVLFVASLFPWPAAVVSAAVESGSHHDQIVAAVLFAGVGLLVPLSIRTLYYYLARKPELLTHSSQVSYVKDGMRKSVVSLVAYPILAAVAFVAPAVSLVGFVALPLFFIATVFAQERWDFAESR